MKRLIKKAEKNIAEMLDDWISDWRGSGQSSIEELMSNYPDCIYSGNAYRVITVNKNELLSALGLSENNTNDLLINLAGVGQQQIVEASKNLIYATQDYVSWSKSKNGITTMGSILSEMGEGDFGLVLQSEVGGFDFAKFIDKYRDEIVDAINNSSGVFLDEDAFGTYLEVEEVVVQGFSSYDVVGEYNRGKVSFY